MGYVARNHFKVIVLAVLGAAEQNSGANAAAAAEARDQTMRPHDSTHTDWLTYEPTETTCASGVAQKNTAAGWECVALSGWAVVTDPAPSIGKSGARRPPYIHTTAHAEIFCAPYLTIIPLNNMT